MKEGVSPRGLTSLALGIIGRAKHRDWHCEEQPGGGGVSYEIHATFTASTGWGPCKDANAFINRSLISPRLLGAAAPRRVQASRVQKGLMGKGEAGAAAASEQCYNLLCNLVSISRKYWRNLRSVLAKLTVK